MTEAVVSMSEKSNINLKWLMVAVLVVLFDQATKFTAQSLLYTGEDFNILPWLSFTLAYNKGAAFSLFYHQSGWQTIFFIILALLVSVYLVYYLMRLKNGSTLLKVGISLILGGAIGNMLDRIWYGYVVDFILLYYKSFSWPVFNLADTAITSGAALLLMSSTTNDKDSSANS